MKKGTKFTNILSKTCLCYVKLIAILYVEGIGYLSHISISDQISLWKKQNKCIITAFVTTVN